MVATQSYEHPTYIRDMRAEKFGGAYYSKPSGALLKAPHFEILTALRPILHVPHNGNLRGFSNFLPVSHSQRRISVQIKIFHLIRCPISLHSFGFLQKIFKIVHMLTCRNIIMCTDSFRFCQNIYDRSCVHLS